MLPQLTATGRIKRIGIDDGYHGRQRQPPFRADTLLEAYLSGYQMGAEQRQLEIEDGTHLSLRHGYEYRRYRSRRTA